MIAAIKLADGNTILELDTDTGEITERGQSFPVLHRPVEDTWELLKLFLTHKQAILAAYQKSKVKLSESDVRVSAILDDMPSESGTQQGYTSSITIDKELRGTGVTLHKTRGA